MKSNAETLTLEVVGDLLVNRHITEANLLAELLPMAKRGDIVAITRISDMAQMRWLGDLYMPTLTAVEWYEKIHALKKAWK